MNSTEDGESGGDWAEDDYYTWFYSVGPWEIASFYITSICSGISLLSSICILLETRQSKLCVHRILFWMQFGLIFHSTAAIFGTMPSYDEHLSGAKGNQFTCSLQGFFLQLGGVLTLLWDMGLSSVFLLIVKYSWSDRQLSCLMKVFHGTNWSIGLLLAVSPLFLELYNPYWDMCYIDAYPFGCEVDNDTPCERGDPLAAAVFYLVELALIFAALATSIVCMAMLYCHVRKIEDRSHRYSFQSAAARSRSSHPSESMNDSNAANHEARGSSTSRPSNSTNASNVAENRRSSVENRRRSRAVAMQGILYSGTILVANVPTVINTFWSAPWFLVVTAATRNLYAFYYLLVFLRMQPKLTTRYGRFLSRLLLGGCNIGCCKSGTRKRPPSSRPSSNPTPHYGTPKALEAAEAGSNPAGKATMMPQDVLPHPDDTTDAGEHDDNNTPLTAINLEERKPEETASSTNLERNAKLFNQPPERAESGVSFFQESGVHDSYDENEVEEQQVA